MEAYEISIVKVALCTSLLMPYFLQGYTGYYVDPAELLENSNLCHFTQFNSKIRWFGYGFMSSKTFFQ